MYLLLDPSFIYLSFLFILFSVGYDDRKMILDGKFSYDSENQRALPFTVNIQELNDEMKIFSGSSSKFHFLHTYD